MLRALRSRVRVRIRTGVVERAVVTLHVVWTQDPQAPHSSKSGGRGVLLLASGSHWEERSVNWRSRPEVGREVGNFPAETGDVVRVDVTPLVRDVVKNAQLHSHSQSEDNKKITFAIRSPVSKWVKYHSRYSKDTSKHPVLTVVVSGQGVNYRYIRNAHGHGHGHGHGSKQRSDTVVSVTALSPIADGNGSSNPRARDVPPF